jgi:uncharacterized protein
MNLQVGYNTDFEMRQETIFADCKSPITLLFLSDFHFNKWNGAIVDKIIIQINTLNPDIILFGGDYIDTKSGLTHLERLLAALADRKNVFAIAGNHDYFFGIKKIKTVMLSHNIIWIEKQSFSLSLKDTHIRIDGNLPFFGKKDADIAILCLHEPIDIQPFASVYNLAFAGHLHGSQFVFWQNERGLYPGRWFYKWNILKTSIQNCAYFISKGLGDTLPIRYNCIKDILFIQILPCHKI